MLRFCILVFFSCLVFPLFIFHLSFSPRYDSWDMSRSRVVVFTHMLEDHRCYVRIHRRILRI